MYKFERYRQLGLADFNQPIGLKMNLETATMSIESQWKEHLPLQNKNMGSV